MDKKRNGNTRVYFLVSRDYSTNDFKIMFLNGAKRFELSDLDLETIKYNSKLELIDNLNKENDIDSDQDIFIAGISRDDKLDIYEVIYNKTGFRRNDALKNFIKVNNSNNSSFTKKSGQNIIYEFMNKYKNDLCYRDIVKFGFTNIPKYFLYLFNEGSGKLKSNINLYNHLGGAYFTDYKLLRNIVESFNRYDDLIKQHKDYVEGESDVFDDAMDYFNKYQSDRNHIIKDLKNTIKIIDDKKSGDSQMSLFDSFTYELEEAKRNEERQKELDDDLIYITDTVLKIPQKTISKLDNDYKFNPNMFRYYSTKFDKEFLTTDFDKTFIELVDKVIVARDDMENDESLEVEFKYFMKDLIDYLNEHEKTLNNAFNWCKVYNRNSEYQNKMKLKAGKHYEYTNRDGEE